MEGTLVKAVQGEPKQNRGSAVPCPEKGNWEDKAVEPGLGRP